MGACRVLWYGRSRDVVEETLQSSRPAFYTRGPAYIKPYQRKSAQQHMGAKPGPKCRTTEGGVKYTLPRPNLMPILPYTCAHAAVFADPNLCRLKLLCATSCRSPIWGPLGLANQLSGYFVLDHTDHSIFATLAL